MKIGIDARMYRGSVAGIGRYSQNLIQNLLAIDHDDEFVLFMTAKDAQEYHAKQKTAKNCKIIQIDIPHYSLTEQTKLLKIIEKENLDLMHFLNFNFPVCYKGKFIVTIHDLTLLFFPDTAKRTNFIKKLAFKYTMKKACTNSAQIIADSVNTKKDIIKYFKVPQGKIKVVYLAASSDFHPVISPNIINEIKKKYKIDKPVILSIGQFRPHKNLVGLVEAFGILRKQIPCQLVILGKSDPKHTSLQEAIDASTSSASTLSDNRRVDKIAEKKDIIMPGFVSDVELASWYKIATCFVFPSLYEGFGLPGLEAMQAGTPVVASNSSSLPEIYHEAAVYFDPFKIQEISDKIKEVLEDEKLRAKLIASGQKIAQSYCWEKTAQETLKIYKETVKQSTID